MLPAGKGEASLSRWCHFILFFVILVYLCETIWYLHLALCQPIMALSGPHLPSITAGSKRESLGSVRGIKKKKEEKCPACRMPHQRLTQGFCTLQSTAIHSGAILSAFFSFISKLLKTTLWMGRWSMSFLLHAISHHPCPPLPAYIHTSFNSNRKSKRREKEKVPSLSIFPVFPL